MVARFAVLLLLYAFLFAVLRIAWRDFSAAAPARRGSVGRAFLVVVDGEGHRIKTGSRMPVEGVASIGRDSDNQVVLDDATVSGRHAAVVFRDARWWVEDLGSTNGTWVAGRPVQQAAPVNPGDVIQVGRVCLRLM